MRSLVLYTQLPELWSHFEKILAISPANEHGYSLVGAAAYLPNCNLGQSTHSQFWGIMTYFLERKNTQLFQKIKSMKGK